MFKNFVAAVLCIISTVAVAQKDLTYIVHTGSGSASDLIARAIAKDLEKRINRPVVIQNAPGAEGLVALSALSAQKTPALFATGSSLHVFSHVVNNTDVSSLRVLGTVATGATLWYTHPNSGIKNAADLVRAYEKNQSITVASDTLSGRINSITLKHHYKATNVIDVPYKTSTQAATDVAAGQVTVGLNVLNPAIKALIDQGRLIPLAVTTPTSASINGQSVPSLTRHTPVPQFVAAWIMSTHQSDPVTADIQKHFLESMKSPEVSKIVADLGLIHDVKNASETVTFIDSYIAQLRRLQASGIDLK